jgi:Co/Zn/Cd efflux system component
MKIFKNLMMEDTFIKLEDHLFSIMIIMIEKILKLFAKAYKVYKTLYGNAETFLIINFVKNYVLKHHKKKLLKMHSNINVKSQENYLQYF